MQSLAGVICTSVLPVLCSASTASSSQRSYLTAPKSLGTTKLSPRLVSRRRRGDCSKVSWLGKNPVRATSSDENVNSATTTSESEKDVLAAKLAAAEAEAEALKKELALRRAGSKDGDLSKLKIATPEKRIDGTGYREQLFSGPGAKKEPKKWGITEAELFLSKGAPTEGTGLGGPAMEEGADAIITRRLAIGVGLAAAALGLAFIKLPTVLTRPSKPLFFYLTFILRLKDQLQALDETVSDSDLERQLKVASGGLNELKDNFISAAALLDEADTDRASQLGFDIFEYLNQADYSKYFENLGEPTPTQREEFLKFSLQSIKAARRKIQEFLTLVPADELEAAKLQLAR